MPPDQEDRLLTLTLPATDRARHVRGTSEKASDNVEADEEKADKNVEAVEGGPQPGAVEGGQQPGMEVGVVVDAAESMPAGLSTQKSLTKRVEDVEVEQRPLAGVGNMEGWCMATMGLPYKIANGTARFTTATQGMEPSPSPPAGVQSHERTRMDSETPSRLQ
jgi:hypothetical protein